MAQALRQHEDYEHSTRTLTFQAESTATHTIEVTVHDHPLDEDEELSRRRCVIWSTPY